MNVKSSLQSKVKIKQLVIISFYTSLICIFTILIPQIMISGIPFTLQTLIIIIIANIASPTEAFVSTLLYLVLGSIGLPVFSGLKGGIGVLLGPTGGFLLSFPFASFLISKLTTKNFIINLLINLFLGIIFIYLFGTIHMSLVNNISYFDTLVVMIAFIPFDIIKITIGTIIGVRIKKVFARTC